MVSRKNNLYPKRRSNALIFLLPSTHRFCGGGTNVLIFSARVAALREYKLFAGFVELRVILGKNQMPNPLLQKIQSKCSQVVTSGELEVMEDSVDGWQRAADATAKHN